MKKNLRRRRKRNGTGLKGHLKKKSPKGNVDSKPFILIDGNALAYAALYAMGHLSHGDKPVGVIFGFLSKMLTISKKLKSNKFFICWDAHRTHRHDDYPKYKFKRKEKRKEATDEEKEERESFLVQVAELKTKVLHNMGFRNNFGYPGYEGDDLLAVYLDKLKKYGHKIIMVTNDADMYQCLDDCDIWSPSKKKFFTSKHLKSEFNIRPDQWAMAKAIGGCSGDSVIGIKGVSDPKTGTSKAIGYINGKIKKGVIYKRILSREGQKTIERNLPIVTVPYKPELLPRLLLRRDKFSRRRFIKVFDKYGFISFMEKEKLLEWKEFIRR